MNPPNHCIVDNKKYVWDGAVYPDEAEARRIAATYREAGFETHVAAEGDACLVYSRREATGGSAAS
jgi:hypothetical protein